MKDHYDIGVFGLWFGCNYGSLLNGYAVYKTLKSFNKSVLMVNKPNIIQDDKELCEENHNMRFIRKYYDEEDISPNYTYDQLSLLNNICDSFCVGSDQVWNYRLSFHEKMYLPFASSKNMLFSFSSSFGVSNGNIPIEAKDRVGQMLKKFDAITVREKFDEKLLLDSYGIKSQTIIEPVFLLENKEYDTVINNSSLNIKEPYILTYILDNTSEKEKVIEYISKKLKLKVINILDGKYIYGSNQTLKIGDTLQNTSAEDFLYAIKNAIYVITDSFHGTAFSVIFNKQFISIANKKRGNERFTDLLGRLELIDRLILNEDEITPTEDYFKVIDFSVANKKIDEEKKESLLVISKILNHKKNISKVLDIYNKCTGCSACASICPFKAITMEPNKDGFLNPVIDKTKCTNCGLCSKKCVALNPTYINNKDPECYAVLAKDDIREKSSSGGMFTLLADYVFKNKGYVCGAAFDKEFNLNHIIIDNKKDLDKLRGSKYFQSNLQDCFIEIKNLLNKGKMVLFSGMPCQTAGLKSFLQKDYENLITIDILCHGISSPKVFKKYLKDVHNNKKLSDIKFKAKEPWGWHAGINAKFSDGSSYAQPLETDPFYQAYLNSISKNMPCGSCQFNKLPRQGDFTLADFWRVETFEKTLNDNKGTSMVLLNSEKAKQIFNKIKSTAMVAKEVPIQYAIAGNHAVVGPYALHKNRKLFFDNIDTTNFRQLVVACKNNSVNGFCIEDHLRNLSAQDKILYRLASIVAKNYKGRKILTWIKSERFEEILKQYFNLNVEFGLSMRDEAVNNTSIFKFNTIIGNRDKYYLVSLDREYSKEIYDLLNKYSYNEFEDFVFLRHEQINLDNYNLNEKTYTDEFGNVVEGYGTIKHLTIPGWNNHIVLGKNIKGLENFKFDLSSNTEIYVGDNCSFDEATFQIYGPGFNRIHINNNCHFQDPLFKMFGHENITTVFIDSFSSFEKNVDFRANLGNKIYIGKECMFSFDIRMLAGDAHSIFDVRSKENINTMLPNNSNKNNIVIGNHVWVGSKAFIMQGTRIGEGSIVGARSFVKGVYPNNCSIGGNKAKIIKRDICWNHNGWSTNINDCKPYVHLTMDNWQSINSKNILVLGGTQFSGLQLVKNLITNGNNVTIATRMNKADYFGNLVTRIKLDLADRKECEKVLSKKHFDVIFHDIAYCSNYVKNVLDFATCDRYIQLSSIGTYVPYTGNTKETDFNPTNEKLKWEDITNSYIHGKKMADLAIYEKYNNINYAIVRIPYICPTDRLYRYCEDIIKEKPMDIDNINNGAVFARDIDVGKFLAWIANQEFKGTVNFATTRSIKISEIISYIEKRVNKKAIIKKGGEVMPFNTSICGGSVSLNLDILHSLNYPYLIEEDDDWFWKLIDNYIERAKK